MKITNEKLELLKARNREHRIVGRPKIDVNIKVRQVTVTLPGQLMDAFDKFMLDNQLNNKSALIAEAIREYIGNVNEKTQ